MKILTVCLGNICRSPMGQGILEKLIAQRGLEIGVDSAGTSNYHIGEAPDERAIACCANHGIDISFQAARQFTVRDFDEFDLILPMDESNRDNVLRLARDGRDEDKVKLMLSFDPEKHGKSVPDPYFGGKDGFEQVYKMLNRSISNLLDQLEAKR